jgi:hypothetical protein
MTYFIRKGGRFPAPNGIDQAKWENAFGSPDWVLQNNRILGYIEVVAYFLVLAFFPRKAELIAGWLAFKVASKWQTWSTILKVPEEIEGAEFLDYFGAKNVIASHTLQRWFLGNLLNVLAGALAVISVKSEENFLIVCIFIIFCILGRNIIMFQKARTVSS